jgi:hypothetical protein
MRATPEHEVDTEDAPGSVIDRVGVGGQRPIRPIAADEVVAVDHLGGRERAGLDHLRVIGREVCGIARASQSGVQVVDPGVEHGHSYAGAVISGGLSGRCADVRHRLRKVEFVVANRYQSGNRWVGQDVADDRGVDLNEHGVQNELHGAQHLGRWIELEHPIEQ